MRFYIYLTFLLLASTDVKPENFRSVVEKQPVTLPCGKFPVTAGRDTVTWQKGGRIVEKIDSDRFKTLILNGSLRITSVSRGDEGWYVCKVLSNDEYGPTTRDFQMFLGVMCK